MDNVINVSKLCLRCMKKHQNINEVCPHCGFYFPEYRQKPHQLFIYTILKERYLLGVVLGEGGFGITYSAYDLAYRRRVAIKELFIAGAVVRQRNQIVLLDTSERGRKYYEECRAKFLQEASVLQSLRDKDGVVDIYEFFQENGTAYIVMEYLDGVDLKTFLKENGEKISYSNAFRFLQPIMRSLIEIQRGGIIHRDISPDNIRYLDNKKMKLMDFGSAKSVAVKKSNSMVVLFKPGYTPPEQYVSGYLVGPWMDVYAMAATLYRCITGITPKPSIERINDQDIQTPRSLGESVSANVEYVILKGMSLKPENRFLDMRAFYDALKKADSDVRSVSEGRFLSEKSHFKQGKPIETDIGYIELLEKLNSKKISYSWIYALIILEFIFLLIGAMACLLYWK